MARKKSDDTTLDIEYMFAGGDNDNQIVEKLKRSTAKELFKSRKWSRKVWVSTIRMLVDTNVGKFPLSFLSRFLDSVNRTECPARYRRFSD